MYKKLNHAEIANMFDIDEADDLDDSDVDKTYEPSQDSSSSEDEILNNNEIAAVGNNKKTTKKKLNDPGKWERNVRKKCREEGKSYKTVKGVIVEGKENSIGKNLCSDTCRYKCNSISDAERKRIHDYYYSVDRKMKDSYIFACISSSTPAKMKISANKHRQTSIAFNITLKDHSKQRVCKQALCALLSISRSVIDRVKDHIVSGDVGPPTPLHGKHTNRPNKIPVECKEHVYNHIRSFPAEFSHYSRHHNPNRKYLSPILSVSKMYDLYLEKCEQEKTCNKACPVSKDFYQRVFNYEFNLGFGSIKSDVCSKCDSGEADENHYLEVKLGTAQMTFDRNKAKNSDDLIFLTFDMEKTLPLPKIPTSIAFYLSQLWLYNVGVHVESKNLSNGYMHIWLENQAGRGCEEIISSLMAFFDNQEVQDQGKKLIAWSDSCAGQNKNFFIVGFWQLLLASKRFDVIEHKFPEVGHTYMDSDRDFGLIEQNLRKTERIYCESQYIELISKTKKSNPFKVSNISQGLIQGKQIVKHLKLRKANKNADNKKFFFSKIRVLKIDKFGFYKYKTSFEETEFKEVDIRGRGFDPELDLSGSKLESLLDEIRKIPHRKVRAKKVEDIKKQIPFIPRVYKPFYENIEAADDGVADEEGNDTD